ncbi:MAG: hypothetical protein ACLPVF_18370 [Acidimicrobiales bacterium]
MEGRFLDEPSVADLRAATARAAADGMGAVFLTTGPLGDAITLAAALGAGTPALLLGIRTDLTTTPHRHPTVLAREMTALDLVTRGRTVLAFMPPLGDEVAEAIALCREMWRRGIAASDGPRYPVPGAVNRPRPHRDGGPRIALDLTDGSPADRALVEAADLLLVRDGPGAVPATFSGAELCQIQSA